MPRQGDLPSLGILLLSGTDSH